MENEEMKKNKISLNQNSHDNLIDTLVTVQAQLALTVEDLTQSVFDPTIDKTIEKVRIGFKLVYDNIQVLIRDFFQIKKEKDDRIAMLERKYGETLNTLQKESKKQELLSKENESLIDQNMQHVSFCAHLGAVTGHLIWKSSKHPRIVNDWLTEYQSIVDDFLLLATAIVRSFIETFQPSFPAINNDEAQFVMAILGTVTNISAAPGGRKFIVEHKHGEKLIADLVEFLPALVGDTGNAIKKLMLKTLFNVSMNCDGLPYLFKLNIEESIAHCFEDSTPVETLQLVLQLLQSLTYNLADPQILQRLLEKLPMKKIQALSTSECPQAQDVAMKAQEVLINLNNDQANADTLSNVSTLTDESSNIK